MAWLAGTNHIPVDYGPNDIVLVLGGITLCFLDNLLNARIRQKQHQVIIVSYYHIRVNGKCYLYPLFNRKEGIFFLRSFLNLGHTLSSLHS